MLYIYISLFEISWCFFVQGLEGSQFLFKESGEVSKKKMKVWGLPNPQRRCNNLSSILWEIDPLSLQAVVFDKLGPSTNKGCKY